LKGLQKSIAFSHFRLKTTVKALVTGANGFIGSHLVDLLLNHRYDVRCLVRRSSDLRWLRDLPVEFVYGDLFDEAALRDASAGVDYVFHSAGLTKSKTKEGYFKANVEGTANLLAAVRKHAPALKRFVLLSSQTAAGPSPTRIPITEDVVPRPITTYGKSKLQAEAECLRLGSTLPVTVLRLPAIYGPRDKDIFEFFNTIGKGLQPMVGFKEKYISLLHVEDTVRGVLMAAESPKAAGQTYFISSSSMYGWREIGNVSRELLGTRVLRIRIPEFGVYVISAFNEFFALFSKKPALINFEKARDMVQDYWTCDSSKAERDFGYRQAMSLEEGIRNTIEWYKKEGWL
jgi:dihydroflavonol-4-reductase